MLTNAARQYSAPPLALRRIAGKTMRKLRIGIIDLVTKGPTRALYARLMNANFASIMPQVVAVWCAEAGHDVALVCYTGVEDLVDELPERVDLVFIGAFTEAAHTAYALSALFRWHGAVTALGGPHARCYPQDATQYFDYVLGFTGKFKRPRVGWHDPNFGVRFDDYMDAIEAAVPLDSVDFIAESSLSLLSEAHLKRLKRNGFKV